MAETERTVRVKFDGTSRGLERASRSGERAVRSFHRTLDAARKVATRVPRTIGLVTSTLAAVAAMAGPAVTGLLHLGKAAAATGKALAGLAPAAAILPSLAAGAGLIGLTIKTALPAMGEALKVVASRFEKISVQVGKVASKGLPQLGRAFATVNLPTIGRGMAEIAASTNRVVLAVGRWVNSRRGQELVRTLTDSTAAAMRRLEGPAVRVAVAFGDLVRRVGGSKLRTTAVWLGRIADATARWVDSITGQDVENAVSDLAGFGVKVRDVFLVLRDVGRWMAENEGTVRAFSDAVAVGAIAVGAASGNVFAVIAGAFALVVNHWDRTKELLSGAVGFFSGIWKSISSDPNVRGIWDAVMGAFSDFQVRFSIVTRNLGPQVKTMLREWKKAWDEWGPLIKTWWEEVGRPALSALAAMLGGMILTWVMWSTAAAKAMQIVAGTVKWLVRWILNWFGTILDAAAAAFGWMGPLGPKLVTAAENFRKFRDGVNNYLDGIQDEDINVRIKVHGPLTAISDRLQGGAYIRGRAHGGPVGAGRTYLVGERGPELLTMGGQGGHITPNHALGAGDVHVTVNLDGQPFYAMTTEATRRQSWRDRVGRR